MEQRIIMKRIDQILSHPVFREQFALLQEAEKDRIFCRHTMEHFLDVARLMYIYNLGRSGWLFQGNALRRRTSSRYRPL